MGAVFTPGLKVAEDSVVVKERRLPLEGELLVAEGAAVGPDDLVARTELPGKIYPVNVANQLGIPASRLKELMKKDVGDSVEEGELIAETLYDACSDDVTLDLLLRREDVGQLRFVDGGEARFLRAAERAFHVRTCSFPAEPPGPRWAITQLLPKPSDGSSGTGLELCELEPG